MPPITRLREIIPLLPSHATLTIRTDYTDHTTPTSFQLSKGVISGIIIATIAFTAAFIVLAFGCYQRWQERNVAREAMEKETNHHHHQQQMPRFEWGGLIYHNEPSSRGSLIPSQHPQHPQYHHQGQGQGQQGQQRRGEDGSGVRLLATPNMTPEPSPRLGPVGGRRAGGRFEEEFPPPPDYQTAVSVEDGGLVGVDGKISKQFAGKLRSMSPQPELPERVLRR